MDERCLSGREQETREDPPGQPDSRPLLEDLRQRVESGIDHQDVAREARRDAARDRKQQRSRGPRRVGKEPPPRLVDRDRGEEQEVRVIEKEGGMIPCIPAGNAGGEPLYEVLDAEQGRGSPLPGLLHPEEESRLSRRPSRAEDPEEHSRDGRETGQQRTRERLPVGPRRRHSPRGGEGFEGQREREGERGQAARSREQAQDGRGGRAVAASLSKRREREQKKQRLRVHRDQKERGWIEKQKEHGVAGPLLAQPAASLGCKQKPGGQKTEKREDLPRHEPVHRHERPHATSQIRIERKEGVGGLLAGSRRGAIAPLEDRQVPAQVIARERRSASLNLARPELAPRDWQDVAGDVGPGQNERRPGREKTRGVDVKPAATD